MNHLTDGEFVDLLDGILPEKRVAHIGGCDRCRGRADMLRLALARALANDGPEPSPLFWDHFSARVSDAVRREPPPAESVTVSWRNWFRHPASRWAAASSLAILLMVAAAWRATLHAPPVAQHGGPAIARGGSTAPPDVLVDDVDADQSWAVVRAAAEGLEWEDAHEAGISARPGSAERVALELSAAEREALVHLLETELKRTGA